MAIYRGGRPTYGQVVGILMVDTGFPRIPGDLGHHATFPFPVLYRVVPGATPRRVCWDADPSVIEPMITAARELESAGVRAITTDSGFLALFHSRLAGAVRVPMITSSLMQVPMVSRMVGGRPVGIIAAHSSNLTDRHFQGVGWSSGEVSVVVQGLDDSVLFAASGKDETARLNIDFDIMRGQVAAAARRMVEERPETAAIVLECTQLAPYAALLQQAVDRPVFSIVTLVRMVYAALERREFVGHM